MQTINREITSATLSYVDENGRRVSLAAKSVTVLSAFALRYSKNSIAFVTTISDAGALRVLTYKDGAYVNTFDISPDATRLCNLCGQPTTDQSGVHDECARTENARADAA